MSTNGDELAKLRKELSDLEKQEEEAKKKNEAAKLENERLLKLKAETEKEIEQRKENSRICEDNSNSQKKEEQENLKQNFDSKEIDSLTNKILIGRGPDSWTFRTTKNYFLAFREIEFIRSDKNNDESLRRLEQELDIINKLKHPNIIKTFGINIIDFSKPTIITEYCPYNLLSLIVQLKSAERVTVLYETCFALNEIHKANLIHLNLKPENILLTQEKHVKISDTGFSKIEETETEMLGLSTLRFTAPELLVNGEKKVTEKVDVFSFAFVTFFVLTKGKYPRMTIDDVLSKKES